MDHRKLVSLEKRFIPFPELMIFYQDEKNGFYYNCSQFKLDVFLDYQLEQIENGRLDYYLGVITDQPVTKCILL